MSGSGLGVGVDGHRASLGYDCDYQRYTPSLVPPPNSSRNVPVTSPTE